MPLVGGKKQVIQSAPEQSLEPILGSSVIVIQPGSLNLYIGRATDTLPVCVPHCIARRHKRPGEQKRHEDAWLMRKECLNTDTEDIHTEGVRSAEDMIQVRPMSNGEYRQPTVPYEMAELNSEFDCDISNEKSNISWTKTQFDPALIVGNEALHMDPSEPYDLHWPIRHGRLHLHRGPSGSLSSVLKDLEDIWGWVIRYKLDVPLKDLKFYRAILLIPDIYNRQHIREMFDILLTRLGFSAAFMLQESVCGTFGTGASSACVVDVGDQKTSICCVEDGISQTNTRLTMDFGGSDITRCFHWLLLRCGFPYKECSLADRMDALFLQELKETYCHMDQDLCGRHGLHMNLNRPGEPVVKYTMYAGDERLLAPLGVFHPEMFGLAGEQLCHKVEMKISDPADPFDDDYLKQTMSRHEQAARAIAARKRENAEKATADQSMVEDADLDDEDTVDPSEPTDPSQPKRQEESLNTMDLSLIGIDQAILQSIERCENDDMKRRMYSCVMVIGGGLMFPGLHGWLQHLLWTQMPAAMRLSIESMDIITKTKDLDPQVICWKGAAVVSLMDTTHELWITQSEWTQLGVRILREKAMFIW
ncbi:hypothetical protein CAPTEDRAFT_229124 [Capitella teleta]|uniref:Actin-related protein 8 n=1 Tax=Capitella teleta TaxID=283909 RepID=R7TU49_CAPTE|nr:hypothetical protein CAPTEDRAFT_229124 [Capitella teleta]|eukprot:ELT94986.1 hypothetical protein CAPTEDRAFT_229124 [Capitella teleta]